MDIHAPESPIHSFKEFAIHIAVVTVGILIALGLEGVREAVVTHHLVRETRANFRSEMSTSRENMQDEMKRVTKGNAKLQALEKQMPAIAQQHPEQVVAVLDSIQNPYYFFSTNSWQAALSSGAPAHMSTDEVAAYAWAAEGTHIYVGLQGAARGSEERAVAFWKSHPHPTSEQTEQGDELLRLYGSDESAMAFVAPQTQRGFDSAWRAAGGK